MSSLVSLIIPVYNVESYVECSLRSALEQTYEDIEYIVVDDCGTDHSMEIVRNMMLTHPRGNRIRVHRHDCNKGLSAARNTGMKVASGEYMFFMDSDDEISSDCIEKHYNAIEDNKADFTIGFVQLEGSKSVHIRSIDFGLLFGDDILQAFLSRKLLMSACNKLYRRGFLMDNHLKFIPGLLHEDILWGLDISKLASKVVCVPYPTYIYKIRSNSITSTSCSPKRLEDLLYILRELVKEKERIVNSVKNERLYDDYVARLQFIFSLLLQSSTLSIAKKKEMYAIVTSLNSKGSMKYSLWLHFPYRLFAIFFHWPYKLYKRQK